MNTQPPLYVARAMILYHPESDLPNQAPLVLLAQRSANGCKRGGGEWELPGGKVDLDPADPETVPSLKALVETALREPEEEVGVVATLNTKPYTVHNYRFPDNNRLRTTTVFIGRALTGTVASPTSPETSRAGWYTPREALARRVLTEVTREALQKLQTENARRAGV